MASEGYSSPWRTLWRSDHQAVLARMPEANRERWLREGFSTVRSRSLFMTSALASGLKVIYVTYVMEQAHLQGVAGDGIPLAEHAGTSGG